LPIYLPLICSSPSRQMRNVDSLLIEKYKIKLMQEKGFKLSAEDIYSVKQSLHEDAVVQFGGVVQEKLFS